MELWSRLRPFLPVGHKVMVMWRSKDSTWKVDGNASKDMVRDSFRSQKCRVLLLSRI